MSDLVFHKRQRKCELHNCLRHVMRLCRWLGFFPVEGVSDTHPGHVRFNLKSVYSIYYGLSLMLLTSAVGTAMAKGHQLYDKKNYAQLWFFTYCFIGISTTAMLYRLAKHWPELIRVATDIESELADIMSSASTHVKTSIISYFLLILGWLEHLMLVSLRLYMVMNYLERTTIDSEVIETFVKHHHIYYLNFFPYSIWTVILTEFVCLQRTFLCTCTDAVGICFSIYLTEYFHHLGEIINSKKRKDWAKIRAAYSRVVILTNLINDQIAPIIVLSSFTNIFFICFQLFNCLYSIMAPSYLTYYVFSFIFLITKAIMFAHYTANVHTSTYKSVLALYEVPASEYNVDVLSLQMQLQFTPVALSGFFFHVKRKMFLRVIATVITYELVLMQFCYQGHRYSYFDYTMQF